MSPETARAPECARRLLAYVPPDTGVLGDLPEPCPPGPFLRVGAIDDDEDGVHAPDQQPPAGFCQEHAPHDRVLGVIVGHLRQHGADGVALGATASESQFAGPGVCTVGALEEKHTAVT